MSEKAWKQMVPSHYFDPSHFFEDQHSLNPLQSGPECTPRGFMTSAPQRNVMGQSTDMSPLVSMLQRFLNPLNLLINDEMRLIM